MMTREVNINRIESRPFDPRLFLTEQELDRGVGLLLMAERALNAAGEEARKAAGLSKSEQRVLLAIRYEPGQTISGLRDRLGMTVPTFARLIGELDNRGLIARTQGRMDGRTRKLTLSKAGTALTTPLSTALRDKLRLAWREAGADQVAGARAMLEALTHD